MLQLFCALPSDVLQTNNYLQIAKHSFKKSENTFWLSLVAVATTYSSYNDPEC